MSSKYKSYWYSKIEPSNEPPGIIRFLIKIGCSSREALLIVMLVSLLGFISAGYIYVLDKKGKGEKGYYSYSHVPGESAKR